MQHYQPIDLGFVTADGDCPEIHFEGGNIRFSFVDWREQTIKLIASDVRAFSWLEGLDVQGIRDDIVYEVIESELIQRYCAWNVIKSQDGYRHFKLCFNAAGVFDVVCTGIHAA